MSNEEFRRQMEIAKAIVEKWPANMQNILEVYSSPTVSIPRKPVTPKNETQEKEKKD